LYNVPIAAAVTLSPAPLVLVARIIGSVGAAITHPIASVSAIPANWARVALSTDSFSPPEPLPQSETIGHPGAPALRIHMFAQFAAWRFSDISATERIVRVPLWFIFAGVVFIPALAYRFSVKTSTIVYAPFLWVIHDRMNSRLPVEQQLEELHHGVVEILRRWYAAISLLGFTVLPLLIFIRWQHLLHWLNERLGRELITFYTVVYEIHLWHASRMVNAVITLALWIFADSALRRAKFGNSWSESTTRTTIAVATAVRALLGFYGIAVGVKTYWTAIDWSRIRIVFDVW
jgi:hypothetical protein